MLCSVRDCIKFFLFHFLESTHYISGLSPPFVLCMITWTCIYFEFDKSLSYGDYFWSIHSYAISFRVHAGNLTFMLGWLGWYVRKCNNYWYQCMIAWLEFWIILLALNSSTFNIQSVHSGWYLRRLRTLPFIQKSNINFYILNGIPCIWYHLPIHHSFVHIS